MRPVNSPFKFLDSYQQEDTNIFFGREKETDALYNALSGVKHLLVYGPSGAGKTSLIECGLRNQFSDADWFAVSIRRGGNMTASVFARINEALHEKIDLDPQTKLPQNPDFDFGEAIENLFAERYQPVYLLFDQFEELLILGDEAEKKDFFTRLNRLIRYKVPCRVMLVMREEFIGHLSEFEPLCPSIFQHRFRLEKMGRSNVQSVIQQILEAEKYRPDFRVEQPAALAKSILAKLPDTQREIELAHVQVFLEELWDRATAENKTPKPTLHSGLVNENDNLERVLNSFLKKQLEQLERSHGEKVPLELLAAMISERHTKLQLGAGDLKNALAKNGVALQKPLPDLLRDLEQRRIIRTLKSGEQTQFEISHDVLALVVGQNLTEEMKLRERAREIYRVYEGRAGMFSREDLDYLRAFEVYLGYSEGLGRRILESDNLLSAQMQAEKIEIERRRRRALRTAVVASALILVAVVASALALQTLNRAKQAEENAEIAKSEQYLANRFAEQKKREAKESENFAEVKTNEANAAERQAEISKRLAELKTKEAKTAVDLAEIKKLEAEKAVLQANALLEASKLLAVNRLPKNFDALIPLDSLNLSGWGLENLSPEIGKLRNLQMLNISSNALKHLPPEICKLEKLKILIVNNNRIDSLPSIIKNLTSLKSIDCSWNQISKLPENISNLANLESIDASWNQLNSLPENIGNLRKLEKIDLSKNPFENPVNEFIKCTRLHHLIELDFSSNSLSDVTLELRNLSNLQILNLSGNSLNNLPATISELKSLKTLDLSYNKFDNISIEIRKLVSLPKLDSLILAGVKLESLPPEITEIESLRALDLRSNELKTFPRQIQNMKNLENLILNANSLGHIPTDILKMNSLKKLDLYNCHLSQIPEGIKFLENLESLNIAKNNLTSLPDEIGELKNLKELVIYDNPLRSLPVESLKKMKNLRLILIKYQFIPSYLNSEVIQKLRENMPWCNIIWEE